MTRARPEIDVSRQTLEYPTAPLDWASVFGDAHPVELEIGPGKGLFLANAAARNPAHNFVGVELARKYARLGAERLAKQGLTNVRMVTGDARKFLAEFVPARSLQTVHIYFPDPWWKKRHHKRRMFCDPFVRDVERALVPGGHFWMATDVADYFAIMNAVMAEHPEFAMQPPPEPTQPEHDLDYLTNFERKYRKEGRPIHRAFAVLTHPVS